MKGKKGQKNLDSKKATQEIEKDARFQHIRNNPVYRRVPKKEKKIEIDERFQSMFKDSSFKLKYKVDERGRPIEKTTDELLKRYYSLKGKDGDSSDTDDTDDSSGTEKIATVVNDVKQYSEATPISESVKTKLRSDVIDYARGEADLLSESDTSSDEELSSDEEKEETDSMHEWGEIDKEATEIENSTSRLALCNMDWDRVSAEDIMMLLHSFLPPGGVMKSVTIYPSEFGKKRIQEEEIKGPQELIEQDEQSIEESDLIAHDDDEDNQYDMNKLRKYQLKRLQYYYAVVEFDSIESAEKVYSECDGMEYESSSSRIDLRFIPEDMSFDDAPKDQCTQLPDQLKYQPKFFTTTALQQMKVDLTWDETDRSRVDLTKKIYDPKSKFDEDDVLAYLASSSDEASDYENDRNRETDVNDQPDGDSISKYRALIDSINSKEAKEKEETGLEITWGIGLQEKSKKAIEKKLLEEEKKKLTPWEEMLEKRKEKKKARRLEKQINPVHSTSIMEDDQESSEKEDSDSNSNQPFSDDDVDVDMNDEFFRGEMRTNSVMKTNRGKKKTKLLSDEKNKASSGPQKDEALSLLLMDDDDGKNHFSLKKIMESENLTKSKKKRRKRKAEEISLKDNKDNFKIDVEDARFSALFNSHLYNIDPSDPNYKKTQAMETIIQEKVKRKANKTQNVEESSPHGSSCPQQEKTSKKEISFLVKSIKRNAKNFTGKKGSSFNRRK